MQFFQLKLMKKGLVEILTRIAKKVVQKNGMRLESGKVRGIAKGVTETRLLCEDECKVHRRFKKMLRIHRHLHMFRKSSLYTRGGQFFSSTGRI